MMPSNIEEVDPPIINDLTVVVPAVGDRDVFIESKLPMPTVASILRQLADALDGVEEARE